MLLRDILIIISVCSLIVTGAFVFIGNIPVTSTDPIYTEFIVLVQGNLSTYTDSTSSNISGELETGTGATIGSSDTARTAWAIIKTTVKAPAMIITIITNAGRALGLPSWATAGILSLIMITITYLALSTITRTRS